jgi:hypothetical protein
LERISLTIDTTIYRQRFGEGEYGGRNALWKVLCDRWFSRFIGPEMTVVDLVAGACEFINNIRCGPKIAIDHNPDVEKFVAPGVRCVVSG